MTVRQPEVSIQTTFKPFKGFENKYQNVPVDGNPIQIPGTLDPMAGKDGYDPNLTAGIPLTLGSDVLCYIPRIVAEYGEVTPIYTYQFIWRMRATVESAKDKEARVSGNLGRNLIGVPEASGTSPGKRFVISSAVNPVYTEQSPPGSPSAPLTIDVRGQLFRILGGEWQAPLSSQAPSPTTPAAEKLNNAGISSQGLYPDTAISGTGPDYGRAGWRGGPNYIPVFLKAYGNELQIIVSRAAPPGEENWDFAGLDREFSKFFGTDNGSQEPIPNTGVQVYAGSFT